MESGKTFSVNKETESLFEFCFSIRTSIIEYQEVIRKGLPDYYLGLDQPRIVECSEHFENYFHYLRHGLEVSSSWEQVAILLEERSLHSYFDGSRFLGPSTDPLVNTCVCEYLDIFYSLLSVRLFGLRDRIKALSIEQFQFNNICLLSDQDIKDYFKERATASDALAQMNFLSKLKKELKTPVKGFFFHFSFQRRRIYKLERNLEDLLKWIKECVKGLTPLICLKNRTQKEGMKFFFSEAIANKKLEIDSLDSFIESRFYIQGSSPNSIGRADFHFTVGDQGIPSELIREIFIKVQKLKAENPKRNIQKWLFQLFFDHEGEGFSTYNIKKVTESLSVE